MKNKFEYIEATYKDYDKRAVEFITKIFEDLSKNNEKISNYHLCMCDLLVVQLQIYFTACDQMKGLTDLTTTDSYARAAKSPVISVLNKAHANIIDIMQKLSLSSLEIAKLKRLNKGDDDETTKELLNELIS